MQISAKERNNQFNQIYEFHDITEHDIIWRTAARVSFPDPIIVSHVTSSQAY